MTEVTVNLLSSGTSIVLPKEPLLAMFPESILAQAAQAPEGVSFDIANPLVTPESLSFIAEILQSGQLPVTPPPNITSMLAAFDYLNLPQLNLLTDAYYPIFRWSHPEINLLQIKPALQNKTRYLSLLRELIQAQAPVLGRYIIENAPDNSEIQRINAGLFVYAASLGQSEIVSDLLPRVDPVAAEMDYNDARQDNDFHDYEERHIEKAKNQALLFAALYGQTEVIRVLLADMRIKDTGDALSLARRAGSFPSWQLLVMDPRTSE